MDLNLHRKIVYIVFEAVYVLSMCIYAYGLKDRAYLKKKRIVAFAFAVMFIDILVYFYISNTIIYLLVGIAVTIAVLLQYSGEVIKSTVAAVFWMFVASVSELMASNVTMLITDFEVSEVFTNDLTYTLINCFARFLVLIFAIVFCGIQKRDKSIKKSPVYWGISIVVFAGSTFIVQAFYHVWYDNNRESDFELLAVVLILSIINILIYYLYEQQTKHYALKSEVERMKTNVCKQKQYYEEERIIYEDKRKEDDDIENFFTSVKNQMEKHDYETALDLIKEKKGRVYMRKKINSGCRDIDIILGYKIAVAEEKGITVKTDFNLYNTLEISAEDLAVLLGNAMDNAIEAVEKMKSPYIDIMICTKMGCTIIEIKNPVEHTVNIKHGIIKTTKQESGHGLGIKSMRSIVENYSGEIRLECDENVFTLKMCIYT